jgi:hypothetical protein
MRLISVVTATTMLSFSFVYIIQVASGSCSGRYPKIYVFNSPYAETTVGEYTLDNSEYNGAPVYKRTAGGSTYSLYRRKNGYWYLDFNEISEDYDGSVSYSDDSDKSYPWNTGWKGDTVVLITKAVFVFGASYPQSSEGKYETDGTLHQGYPVYTKSVGGWFLYRRSDGKWYHTFESSLPDSGGAILYGQNVAVHPWDTVFYPATGKVLPLLECEV